MLWLTDSDHVYPSHAYIHVLWIPEMNAVCWYIYIYMEYNPQSWVDTSAISHCGVIAEWIYVFINFTLPMKYCGTSTRPLWNAYIYIYLCHDRWARSLEPLWQEKHVRTAASACPSCWWWWVSTDSLSMFLEKNINIKSMWSVLIFILISMSDSTPWPFRVSNEFCLLNYKNLIIRNRLKRLYNNIKFKVKFV